MDFNKNIDNNSALDYVNKQIKEKSKAWVSSLLDKRDREENSERINFSEADENLYEVTTRQLRGKNQTQINKIFSKMTEDEYKTYTKVGEQKQDINMLEADVLRMEKMEKFLETAVALRDELISKMPKTT